MSNKARSLLVLDHHKSTEADLAGLSFAVFDMQRSGAGMAWDWYHPGKPRPPLVNLVEDNDLWRHALPGSREFQLRMDVEPMNFGTCDRIAAMSRKELDDFIREGGVLKLAFDREVATLLEDCYAVTLDGQTGLAVNASGRYSSEAGHRLALMCGTFGMVWRQLDGRLKISLRSVGDYDVAELCGRFGGGGHRNAASFTLPVSAENFSRISGSGAAPEPK